MRDVEQGMRVAWYSRGRRLRPVRTVLGVLLTLTLLAGCEWKEMTSEDNGRKTATAVAAAQSSSTSEVVAVKTTAAPTVDGKGTDEAWSKAPIAIIPVQGYSGKQISLKAVYTDTDIFFLLSWSDYSHSIRQRGSWGRVHVGAQFGKAPTEAIDKWERFGSEDALSWIWNLDAPDFSREDFPTKAHLPGIKTHKGRMDRWWWGAGSTDPVHRFLDQYIDQAGVHDDSGTSFLIPNVNAEDDPATSHNETAYPAYMPRYDLTQPKIPKLFVVKGEKPVLLYYRSEVAPFDLATVDREATLPGYIFEDNPSGSVIDVAVQSAYSEADETWTLEVQRSLTTSTPGEDLQFTELSKAYSFVIGVFDDTDIDGSFSQVHTLTFAR